MSKNRTEAIRYIDIIIKNVTNYLRTNYRIKEVENDYRVLFKNNDYWEEVISLKYSKPHVFKNEIINDVKRSEIISQISDAFLYKHLTLKSLLNSMVNNLIEYKNCNTDNYIYLILAYKHWLIFLELLKKFFIY